MLTAHSVEQIREAEAALAATLPKGELMRRAARGLCDFVSERIDSEARIVALIGTGNNGGDALFAAGLLRRRGIAVDVCFVDPDRMHKPGLDAALAAGASIVDSPEGYPVVIDAVVGIGGKPGLRGKAWQWAAWIKRENPTVIAVDLPSGLAADSGRLPEEFLRADAVVTFGTYKVSSFIDPAANVAGGVPQLVDIGLAPFLGGPALEAFEPVDCGAELDRFAPRRDGHKYTRGVVGVAAGSHEFAGAAHLCVAGAQGGLSGMVRFVGPDDLGRRVVDRAPEVVATRGQVQAWTIGSGGGDSAGEQLSMALEDGVPVVVDADALRFLPDRFDVPALLTPHAGELAAMMGTTRSEVEADPLGHVEKAARRWSTTVLLKGRRTLIATVGRPTRVNLSGTPWLATAGSGDVLAGLAGSILAAGADPHTAGSVAAYVHGLASTRANPDGPVTAGQVAAAIPGAIANAVRDHWHEHHLKERDQ